MNRKVLKLFTKQGLDDSPFVKLDVFETWILWIPECASHFKSKSLILDPCC